MTKILDIIDINLKNDLTIVESTSELFSLIVCKNYLISKKNILIVTPSLFEASKIYDSLSNYINEVYLFPNDDYFTVNSLAVSPEFKITRLETINAILKNDKNKIIITHLDGYIKKITSKEEYTSNLLKLKIGQNIDRDKLITILSNLGYQEDSIVSKTGDYAYRGYIIDIFSIEEDHPYRIELFGDEITSIRFFDEKNQRSFENIKEIIIKPFKDLNNSYDNISSYLNDRITIYKDYDVIKNLYERLLLEVPSEDFLNFYKVKEEEKIYYETLENNKISENIINLKSKTISKFYDNVELLNNFLLSNLKNKKTIIISLSKQKVVSFRKYLKISMIETDINNIDEGKINIISDYYLSEGFEYKNYVFLTENEIFKNIIHKKKYKTKFKYAVKISDISNLSKGDYVVHESYGIGMYNGVITLENKGIYKDYLEIIYKNNDKLYIPVSKIELISKYSTKDGIAPKINSLGGSDWKKTKSKVKNKVKNIANELINLYALRKNSKGYVFSEDDEFQKIFENDFEFIETEDQLKAIKEIKKDMTSDIPMDRLLCGDVGYGKTEVAFRAMFKAVNDSKQVLYLCPTTLLSKQQYEVAQKRFSKFPINIKLINRYTTQKEKIEIYEELKNSKIDILFGTHSLLSDNIKPQNLGLLIIDEEQRFGVKDKEKLKKYKNNVDILTMSATPIPRTLQMSLMGIKSISTIETPPIDRYPIETYVFKEDEYVVREAIYKELARNGQIYILYNNILDMEEKEVQIKTLVPQAKILKIHGKMNKEDIEDKMQSFINKEYDILICTTIIETGIDIPNVNTLIIYDADKFGLSQLYQIRGRVGRSNKIAYAYLMYKPSKLLTEEAKKRLNSIKEYTALGSGYKISARDLEIRGAGDILGSEQAGFIDSVGISLYTKILNDEISRIESGIDDEDVEEKEQQENIKSNINLSNYVSNDYVKDDSLKILIHTKINSITNRKEFFLVKEELEDRFGKLNKDILEYMEEQLFDSLSEKYKIEKVVENRLTIEIIFNEDIVNIVDMGELLSKTLQVNKNFKFKSQYKKVILYIQKSYLDKNNIYESLNQILESLELN